MESQPQNPEFRNNPCFTYPNINESNLHNYNTETWIICQHMRFSYLYSEGAFAKSHQSLYCYGSRKFMDESSKFPKSWIFEIQTLKQTVCLQNNNNFTFKWSVVLTHTEIKQRSYYYLLNSGFWGWLSMESQPQNPEFRNNPENFHPWKI